MQREAGERLGPEELPEAAVRASLRVHRRLARLIGRDGVDALFARAVKLAGAEFTWLREFAPTLQAEVWLQEVRDASWGREPAELGNALLAVLAHVLWLLAILIGEDLVLRLVSEAPPESRPQDASLDAEESTT